MEELNDLREQINKIDEALVKLFKERMEVVSKVADFKRRNSMKILDKNREEEIIKKYLKDVEDEGLRCIIREFLEDLMSISRKVQKKVQDETYIQGKIHEKEDYIIGFQGVSASFSHQALNAYFGNEVKNRCYPDFQDVFEAINNEEIKYGVLPIENSSTGGITEVYDLLGKYNFYIIGEKCIKVDQNLLGVYGTELSDIKEVYSHSQGFLQCRKFFDEHGDWKLIPYFNTAKSAQYVSEENVKSKACVASKKAAEIYKLKVLRENINYSSKNYTRFIVIGKNMEHTDKSDKISIVISLPHKAGSLASIINHFAKNNLNLMKIESRPIVDKSWEYFFYIDFEGNISDENTKNALNMVEKESLHLKFLGNYKSEVTYS